MRRLSAITLLLLIAAVYTVRSQGVDSELAADAAGRFISAMFPGSHHSVSGVAAASKGENRALYLVELVPEGWVLVAGNMAARPVLGYSLSGSFAAGSGNQASDDWIAGLSRAVESLAAKGDGAVHPEWQGYSKSLALADGDVAPLISMKWNQGDGWNLYCPVAVGGPGGRTWVGCVAVAMGQALSVFGNPPSGVSSNSYNHYIYGTISTSYSDAVYRWDLVEAAVPNEHSALILYHCATSVEMDFGEDASSATTADAADAMPAYFRMSRGMKYLSRLDAVDSYWKNLLRQELRAGRPIIYRGRSDDGTSGHAFNMDGVQFEDYFHINWGWGGSNDGYFIIDELNPTDTRSYNRSQAAITGIRPFNYPVSMELSDTIVIEGRPAGTAVGIVVVEDESDENVYHFGLVCDSVMVDNSWIKHYYMDGDTLRTGVVFSAGSGVADTLIINLTDIYGNSLSQSFVLSFRDAGSVGVDSEEEESAIIYPNPAGDWLRIDLNGRGEIREVTIFNPAGVPVRLVKRPSAAETINIAGLPEGLYILRIDLSDGATILKKIVKTGH